eukprot:13372453-Alexandrium_andersonii.AAC.1
MCIRDRPPSAQSVSGGSASRLRARRAAGHSPRRSSRALPQQWHRPRTATWACVGPPGHPLCPQPTEPGEAGRPRRGQ